MRELYPTKLHACLARHAPELEAKAKNGELAEEAFRAKYGTIEFHYQGLLIRFGCLPGWEPYERESDAKRGTIGGFSRKARTRMMELCAKIRSDAPALFVTLTYPRTWPGEASRWKRDLDAFGKWLRRTVPAASAVWKLEPQERGAPHFHLLVWGVAYLAHNLIAQRWFEIVGSGDTSHRAAGTSIERVRSARGVRRYASKSYMGKELVLPAGWDRVGKFWGVIGRKHLPLSACKLIMAKKNSMIRVRRIVRRYLRSKGMRRGAKSSVRLYTEEHLQWVRVVDWANGLPIPPLQDFLAKPAKRSAEKVPPEPPGAKPNSIPAGSRKSPP